MARSIVDWESVEREYRAGIRSLRDIGGEFGCTEGAIRKKAKEKDWSRDLSAKISAKAEVVLKPKQDLMDAQGFVYVLYLSDSSGDEFYKIGLSANFPARLATHQCSSPFDVCVACAYYVGNMRSEERYLHSRFQNNRVRGEWFKLSSSDLDEISARARLV